MVLPLGIMVEDTATGTFGRLLQEDDSLILAGALDVHEHFDGALGTLAATNSVFNLFNSPGASTIEGITTDATKLPAVGDHWARFLGDTRVVKDNDGLAGGSGIYSSGCVRLQNGGPRASTRICVYEASAANGGVDTACIHYDQATGKLQMIDSDTVFDTNKSARVLQEVEWTRWEWFMSSLTQTQELRLFYGPNLWAPWWHPNETLNFTMAVSSLPTEVYGIGLFLGNALDPTKGFDFGYIRSGHGIWQGPPEGVRPVRGQNAGTARLEIPTVGAST
jgi:hypothetical protein